MTALTYWRDTSPFVMRTTIRATPVNTKFGALSANLQQITAQINGFVVKLPETFIGNTQIAAQSYTDKLVYINKAGDMDLIARGQLIGEANTDVEMVNELTNALTVTGDNHSQFFSMDYVLPASPTAAQSKIIVTVGKALRTIDGDLVSVPGTIIFFTNNSDAELWLAPDEVQGVTIESPGTLRAYGKHSSLALLSLSETKWLLMGDMYLNDVVV
ncbi:hypothetical protein [Shewanella sp. T24-MNA-CIBAN-0130]|uniref:hypothetical protein n=1 Tax=Shewanella sp. T24-MNA-CIBAN-0130 TaxID=3140470 RepID=UPI003328F017